MEGYRVASRSTVIATVGFIIFDFIAEESPSVAFVEAPAGDVYFSGEEDVAHYSGLFGRLQGVALSPEKSVEYLRSFAADIERYVGPVAAGGLRPARRRPEGRRVNAHAPLRLSWTRAVDGAEWPCADACRAILDAHGGGGSTAAQRQMLALLAAAMVETGQRDTSVMYRRFVGWALVPGERCHVCQGLRHAYSRSTAWRAGRCGAALALLRERGLVVTMPQRGDLRRGLSAPWPLAPTVPTWSGLVVELGQDQGSGRLPGSPE